MKKEWANAYVKKVALLSVDESMRADRVCIVAMSRSFRDCEIAEHLNLSTEGVRAIRQEIENGY